MGSYEVLSDAEKFAARDGGRVPVESYSLVRRHLKGPFTVKDRRRLGRWFTNHDLETLATEAGIEPSNNEIRILGMLASLVRWAGSYPTSMQPGDWDYPRWRVPEDGELFACCGIESKEPYQTGPND